MKKLGIYARQSVEKETTGSIDDQIIEGKKQAEVLRLPYEVYVDRGLTAAKDTLDNRPEFMRLLEDIKSGLIDVVFVVDQSRLSRNQATQLYIKQVLSVNKVKVYTKLDGIIDYEDTDSELLADIRALFNTKMVKDTSKKIKSVLLNNAKAGKVGGGLFKSYGYKKGGGNMLITDPDEAEVIKEIYTMYLLGISTNQIARHLNEKGIPSKSSKVLKVGLHLKDKYTGEQRIVLKERMQWSGTVIMAMIKNPIYKGERLYKGEICPAPQIIDSLMWEKAQSQIAQNRNVGGKILHEYLLNDLVYCQRCGNGFRGRTRPSKRDHIYYCASKRNHTKPCGIRSINIDYLNSIVWEIVTDKELITKIAKREVEKLKKPDYIKELEKSKKQLEAQIHLENDAKFKTLEICKRGIITLDEAENDMLKNNAAIKALSSELNNIKTTLENQINTMAIIDEVSEIQRQLQKIKNVEHFETKRKLVKLFIDRIYIDFDDEQEVFTLNLSVKIGGQDINNAIFDKERVVLTLSNRLYKKKHVSTKTEVGHIRWLPENNDQYDIGLFRGKRPRIISPQVGHTHGCGTGGWWYERPTGRNITGT